MPILYDKCYFVSSLIRFLCCNNFIKQRKVPSWPHLESCPSPLQIPLKQKFSAYGGGLGGLPSSWLLMKNASAGPQARGQLLRVWSGHHPVLCESPEWELGTGEGHGLWADRLADLSRTFTLLRVSGWFSTQGSMWKRTQQLACVCVSSSLRCCATEDSCCPLQLQRVVSSQLCSSFQERGEWGDYEIECFLVIPSPPLLNGYLKFLTFSNVTPH